MVTRIGISAARFNMSAGKRWESVARLARVLYSTAEPRGASHLGKGG
jgi:hypothetical protein